MNEECSSLCVMDVMDDAAAAAVDREQNICRKVEREKKTHALEFLRTNQFNDMHHMEDGYI